MKKLLPGLLALALLLTMLPSARAAGSLCFVAVNDTIPLSLPASDAPYYSGGTLYLPYTAFNANPGGVIVSNNVDQNTFVLFTRTSRLVYDLTAGTVTDESGAESPVSVLYRGGLLYIPASAAEHFGYSVSILTAKGGETIIRFTNGSQVYDDSLFVEKAANLIDYLNQQQTDQPDQNTPSQQPWQDTETQDPPEQEPADVYLAFAGAAVSQETLDLLSQYQIRAAFFLTEAQLRADKALVRAIYAQGHTIGLASDGTGDVTEQLTAANEAMDEALFFKTVLALAPQGAYADEGWHLVADIGVPDEAVWRNSTGPSLLVCRGDAPALLERLSNAQAQVLQILETTSLG